jgi:hypothetical protein
MSTRALIKKQEEQERQEMLCDFEIDDYLYEWLIKSNYEITDELELKIVNDITSKLKNKSCLTDDLIKNKLLERIKKYTQTELNNYISEPSKELTLNKTNKYFIEYAKKYIENKEKVPEKITHLALFKHIETLKSLEKINKYFGFKKYDYKKIMKDIIRKQEADYEKDKTLEFMTENTVKNYCKTEEGKKYVSFLEIIFPKKDGKRKSLKRKSLKRKSLKRKSLKRKSLNLKLKSIKRKSKRNKKY